ncbi:MAG: alcohol dehydrogenase catalytic domain-containing protein, partial [Kiritimatiellota bacterium]|nr:alcohol dehydrogenase catalytic domain-containing protein [Kiritimatiellota bacterium]
MPKTSNQQSEINNQIGQQTSPRSPAIPATMRAVRLHGAGFENIHVDTVSVPRPNDNQVLVRVDAAGVCSSILKLVAQGSEHTFINGWDLAKYPIILGDEGCVTIVQAGK